MWDEALPFLFSDGGPTNPAFAGVKTGDGFTGAVIFDCVGFGVDDAPLSRLPMLLLL